MNPANGKFTRVTAVNPQTVCNPEALLACALMSIGVDEHPQFKFRIMQEEVGGKDVTLWVWLFKPKTRCGKYETAQLVKWWKDAAWRKANPAHEWAILCMGMRNMGEVARRVRETIPRIVVRRGRLSAHIPTTASPARRQHLLDKLDGRIPQNEPFVEPAP